MPKNAINSIKKGRINVIGKVFSVLVSLSLVFGIIFGRLDEVSEAVLIGATEAVELSVSTLGFMCLWSGIINVFNDGGVTSIITRLIKPVLKYIYPTAYKEGIAVNEIASNFAANLLGLGNAALPLGLCAAEKLAILEKEGKGADLFTFCVMNTVPPQLFPSTLIILRKASGSLYPDSVIMPIYICSVLTFVFAAFCCRAAEKLFYKKGKI